MDPASAPVDPPRPRLCAVHPTSLSLWPLTLIPTPPCSFSLPFAPVHRFRAVDPVRESSARRAQLQGEALEEVRRGVEELAAAIGHGHMLVQGATRYYGQLCKLVR